SLQLVAIEPVTRFVQMCGQLVQILGRATASETNRTTEPSYEKPNEIVDEKSALGNGWPRHAVVDSSGLVLIIARRHPRDRRSRCNWKSRTHYSRESGHWIADGPLARRPTSISL